MSPQETAGDRRAHALRLLRQYREDLLRQYREDPAGHAEVRRRMRQLIDMEVAEMAQDIKAAFDKLQRWRTIEHRHTQVKLELNNLKCAVCGTFREVMLLCSCRHFSLCHDCAQEMKAMTPLCPPGEVRHETYSMCLVKK